MKKYIFPVSRKRISILSAHLSLLFIFEVSLVAVMCASGRFCSKKNIIPDNNLIFTRAKSKGFSTGYLTFFHN